APGIELSMIVTPPSTISSPGRGVNVNVPSPLSTPSTLLTARSAADMPMTCQLYEKWSPLSSPGSKLARTVTWVPGRTAPCGETTEILAFVGGGAVAVNQVVDV